MKIFENFDQNGDFSHISIQIKIFENFHQNRDF